MLTTHLHLVPKLGISGDILPLPLNGVDMDNFTFLPLLIRHVFRETGKNHEQWRNTSKFRNTNFGRCHYTKLLGERHWPLLLTSEQQNEENTRKVRC